MKLKATFIAASLALLANASFGTVYFQNTGKKEEWPNYPQDPQADGTINNVSTPTYEGTQAIKFTQTYTGYGGRYHSEVTYFDSQKTNDDRYYGLTVYLPSNWVYADDAVCIQQWAGTGPWLMMEVRGSTLVVLPHVAGLQNLGSMPRGQWVRIVTRLKSASSGMFEAWVNGTKRMSLSDNFVADAPSGLIRWSAGLYVTRWYPEPSSTPNPSYRELFQDHYRIASTLGEAEPSSWVIGTAPKITSTPDTTATEGDAYSYDVNASGSPTPTYSLTTSPSGMTVSSSSGVISWTAGSPGSYPVTVKASNGIGPDATQSFTIVVSSNGQLGGSFEAEALAVEGSSSDIVRILADSAASAGNCLMNDTDAAGDFVTLRIPNIAPATYTVKVQFKKHPSRGIVQVMIGKIDGSLGNLGSPIDLYSATPGYQEYTVGTWTPTSTSDKQISFKITGKNGSSSGYTQCIDKITLTPQ